MNESPEERRFTDEEIAFYGPVDRLRLAAGPMGAEPGSTPVRAVRRKMGVTGQTFYRWKKAFAGLTPSELRRLKRLQQESRRLRRLVSDLALDKDKR